MKGSFKFILRDENDLAYKWIKDKRNSPSQNIKGGVSVYALGEYFFNVFFLNKLSGFENANQITKLIKDNNSSKDWISFGEEWNIPFNYEEYLIKKGSVSGFSDIAKELGNQIIYKDKKLTDILSNAEIQSLAVNSYHIFYDVLDAKDNLSYDEILAHPKLFFKDKSELIFLLPCSIKIPVKQVIESKKESVTNVQTGTQKVEVNKKIIVLDPGHGGVWDSDLSKTGDPGASSRDGKTHEATIVLSIAKKLKTKLEQNNYTVILYAKPFVQTLFSKNNELSSHRFYLQSVCYQTCFVNFIRSFVVQPLMNPFTIEELYKFPETFSQFLCT